MDKTKTTDMTENIKENMTDPETSALLQQIFREDEKALLEQAQAQHVEENAERKEALRSRILAAIAEEEASKTGATEAYKALKMGAAEAHDAVRTDVNEDDKMVKTGFAEAYEAVKTDAAEDIEMMTKDATGDNAAKKQKRRFSPALRWVAVLALVCAGVFGVSMTSQAKGSGLWSSIQRLFGLETRWQQEDNGEDRTFTNPDEFKAVCEIESTLGIKVPEFFYWPREIIFSDVEMFEKANSFVVTYQDGDNIVYFEGGKSDQDTTVVNTWEGESAAYIKEYNDTAYTIKEIVYDENKIYYSVSWKNNNSVYMLSGTFEKEELENILKNIKN